MTFPNLDKGQYALLIADKNTGIILNPVSNNYSISNEGNYLIFNDLESADDYIEAKSQEMANIEFIVYNYRNELIKFK